MSRCRISLLHSESHPPLGRLNAVGSHSYSVQVVARHGFRRVDIIDHADIPDADPMIADVMHVLAILGSCAEIAYRHLGVERSERDGDRQ